MKFNPFGMIRNRSRTTTTTVSRRRGRTLGPLGMLAASAGIWWFRNRRRSAAATPV